MLNFKSEATFLSGKLQLRRSLLNACLEYLSDSFNVKNSFKAFFLPVPCNLFILHYSSLTSMQQQAWQNLPVEILRKIFSNLSTEAKECQLTCRHWYEEARKRLYYSVKLESTFQATLFVRSLISSTVEHKQSSEYLQDQQGYGENHQQEVTMSFIRNTNFAKARRPRYHKEQKLLEEESKDIVGKYVRRLYLKHIFSPHLRHWDAYDVLSNLVTYCPYTEEVILLDKPFRNFWVKLMSVRYEGYWQCLKRVSYPYRENEIEFYLLAILACRHTIEDILLCDQLTNRPRGDADYIYEKEYYQVASKLHEFTNLKTLTVKRHTHESIMKFNDMIDACPLLTELSITLYNSRSMQPIVSFQNYSHPNNFMERKQISYLKLETVLSQDVLSYIMKKFTSLRCLKLNMECDEANVGWMRKLHTNYNIDLIDQFIDYLRSITSYGIDHLYIRNIEDMLCRCHIGKEHTLEIRYDHDTKRHDEEDMDNKPRHRFRLVKEEEESSSLATVFYPACHVDLPHIKIVDKCGEHLELLTLDMRQWSNYNYTRIQRLLAGQRSTSPNATSVSVSTLPHVNTLPNNESHESPEEMRQQNQEASGMDQIMYNYHLDRLFRACTSLKRLNLIGLFLLDFDPYLSINQSIEHLSLHLCYIYIPIFYQLSVRLPQLKSLTVNGWYFVEPDGKAHIQTHHNFQIDMPYTAFEQISWLGGTKANTDSNNNNDNDFSIPGSNISNSNNNCYAKKYFYLKVSTLTVEKYLKLDNHVIQLGSPEEFRRCLQNDQILTFHIRCKSLKKFTIKYYQFKRSYLV
ncbi:hypothetical protein BDF20DRAFT_835112 [Mycotypha africana]|uniref:uncharacterized protein n=1 Tax=Mycotypha africana TaxID=64632 RepID=UPI0023004E9A|nr:uncharacterized protein BDF20DRAFT_835112 [Mycotypha africana]KAI8979046.1 hypothetical protein BDF20DRAFT_835112 [Mycotypha africana]